MAKKAALTEGKTRSYTKKSEKWIISKQGIYPYRENKILLWSNGDDA